MYFHIQEKLLQCLFWVWILRMRFFFIFFLNVFIIFMCICICRAPSQKLVCTKHLFLPTHPNSKKKGEVEEKNEYKGMINCQRKHFFHLQMRHIVVASRCTVNVRALPSYPTFLWLTGFTMKMFDLTRHLITWGNKEWGGAGWQKEQLVRCFCLSSQVALLNNFVVVSGILCMQ